VSATKKEARSIMTTARAEVANNADAARMLAMTDRLFGEFDDVSIKTLLTVMDNSRAEVARSARPAL